MLSDIYPELKKTVENPEQWVYEFHVLELRDIEINVEKIIAVTDTNYAELRKRAWKFRLAGIPTLTSGDKHSWSEWTNSVPELKLWNPFRVDNFFLFFFICVNTKALFMSCCYRLPFIVRFCTKKYLVTSSAQAADTCDTNKSKCKHSYQNESRMFLDYKLRIYFITPLVTSLSDFHSRPTQRNSFFRSYNRWGAKL